MIPQNFFLNILKNNALSKKNRLLSKERWPNLTQINFGKIKITQGLIVLEMKDVNG